MATATKEIIEGEIVPLDKTSDDVQVASLYGTMSVSQLKKATEKMAEQRRVITEYVRNQLIEGSDYGKIHINSKCDNKYNCTNTYHFSKAVLFKPGQEKIFSLFNLTAKCYRDDETLEMIGKQSGLVALVCKVYRNGKEIAEGRGAATIGDNGRDANATIKIAEKRARMDACLSLGFSEFFTQDLEDPEYRSLGDGQSEAVKASKPEKASEPATPNQKKFIADLLRMQGIADEEMKGYLTEQYGIADTEKMSKQDASMVIEALKGDAK